MRPDRACVAGSFPSRETFGFSVGGDTVHRVGWGTRTVAARTQAWSGAWVIAAAGAPGRTPCPGRPRPGRHRQARALGLHLVPGSGDPPVTYRRARAPWDADARRAGRPPGVAGRALAAAGGPRSPDRWPPIGSGSARHAAAVPQRPGTPRPVQAHLLSR